MHLDAERILRIVADEQLPEAGRTVEFRLEAHEKHHVVAKGEVREVDGEACFLCHVLSRPQHLFVRIVRVKSGHRLVRHIARAEATDADRSAAIICDVFPVWRKARILARRQTLHLAGFDFLRPHSPSWIALAEAGEADDLSVWMPARRDRRKVARRNRAPLLLAEASHARTVDAPCVEEAFDMPPDQQRTVRRNGRLHKARIVSGWRVHEHARLAPVQINLRNARSGGLAVRLAFGDNAAGRDEIDLLPVRRNRWRIVAAAA